MITNKPTTEKPFSLIPKKPKTGRSMTKSDIDVQNALSLKKKELNSSNFIKIRQSPAKVHKKREITNTIEVNAGIFVTKSPRKKPQLRLEGYQKGKFYFNNGDIYIGEMQDAEFNGFGEYVFSSGEKYRGQWIENERYGRGEAIFSDGSRYYGHWHANSMEGEGKFFYKDGSVYIGNVHKNYMHGKDGVLYFKNGAKFEGTFKRGNYVEGKYTHENGETYVGQFKDNFQHGLGKYTYKNKSYYDGEWFRDKKHGKGVQVNADGSKYVGEFKDNMFNGHGTFYWISGEKYTGNFKNGVYHGYGVFNSMNSTYKGDFKKSDTFFYSDKTQNIYYYNDGIYIGEIDSETSQKEGTGTYCYLDGSKYVGEFEDDKKEGFGIYETYDGMVYAGEFEDDLFNGKGEYKFLSNDIYVGDFKNGMLSGKGEFYDFQSKKIFLREYENQDDIEKYKSSIFLCNELNEN